MPLSMICPRDYTLRSLTGHVLRFQANVPTVVPDDMVADALALNIIPDESQTAGPYNKVSGSITGTLRDAMIFGAIVDLVAKNNPEDFDGGGHPKSDAINRLSGLSLANTERSKYWNRYREIISSNSEMPSHPNTDMVLELQQLVSRRQLEEFAVANEIDFTRLKTKNVKDAKAEMLSLVINQKPHLGLPALQPRAVEVQSSGLVED